MAKDEIDLTPDPITAAMYVVDALNDDPVGTAQAVKHSPYTDAVVRTLMDRLGITTVTVFYEDILKDQTLNPIDVVHEMKGSTHEGIKSYTITIEPCQHRDTDANVH